MAELNVDKMAKTVAERAMKELRDDGVFVARWIPVNERLPEEGVTVLITWNGDIDLGQYEGHKWWWLAEAFCDYWTEAGDVIAWMPLPEPYKEGKEG